MLNKSPSLLLILTLILTACQGAATSTSMVVPSLTTATEIVGASATAPPTAKTSVASCTVVSREPTPGPTEQSLFPPVTLFRSMLFVAFVMLKVSYLDNKQQLAEIRITAVLLVHW